METPNQRAIAEAAKKIYERRRAELEARSHGQFAVIDTSSQEIFVAASDLEAIRNAEANGSGPFFLVRIGFPTAYRMYRMRRASHGHDTRIVR